MPRFYGRTIYFLALATVAGACARRMYREVTPPQEYQTVDERSPFLKAHMRDMQKYGTLMEYIKANEVKG